MKTEHQMLEVTTRAMDKIDFCGCVHYEDVLPEIRKFLEVASAEEFPKKFAELYKERFGMFWFVHHVLDRAGLLTHGGTATGCWLTDFGKEFHVALSVLTDEQIIKSFAIFNGNPVD